MELAIPFESVPAEPMFRSRYGGLWTDRSDAHELLAERKKAGWYDDAEAERLAYYIDHGYVILPGATDPEVVDDYLEFFERSWDEVPEAVMVISKGLTYPMTREFYDKVAKVSSLHLYYPRAGELIFPPEVLTFLQDIYERPPVAFQTMTMRKGSEESLHIDTGPLPLTEPMTLCASWVALEDIQANSGEFQYVPGTHLVPERLHWGVAKGHDNDMAEYGQTLQYIRGQMDERGLKVKNFMAKKGDVLIWHGELMHGGAPIADPSLTRMSLVAHFMPLGVMPAFYDFSNVSTYPYANGGHCLDSIAPRKPRSSRTMTKPTPDAPRTPKSEAAGSTLRRVKDHVPLPVRSFVRQQANWLSRNPLLADRVRSNRSTG